MATLRRDQAKHLQARLDAVASKMRTAFVEPVPPVEVTRAKAVIKKWEDSVDKQRGAHLRAMSLRVLGVREQILFGTPAQALDALTILENEVEHDNARHSRRTRR